jgi:hypothetical protein
MAVLTKKITIMGTSNFYNRNASRTFAFQAEEEWDWDDMKDNISSMMAAIAEKLGFSYYEGGDDLHDNRSFPSNAVARFSTGKQYKGFSVGITLTAIVRSGYYSGGNLDWQIEYDFDGSGESEDLPERRY